jgi:glycosyltransferase involved in cell wall biosynthesis
MVLQRYFPPDIRVEKEARALVKAGHEVFVLSLGREGAPDKEVIDGVRILRWGGHQSKMSWVLDYLSYSVSFVHPFWRQIIAYAARQYNMEAIHVHDLVLVKTGLVIARKLGIPLVADLHENFAEGIKTWVKEWGVLKGSLVQTLIPVRRWEKLERSCIQQADRIITVVDEARSHYLEKYGGSPEKIIVLMNVEDLKYFDRIELDKSICNDYKGRFVISYIGGFEQERELETAIRAMPKVLEQIPNALLLLVGGKGSKVYMKKLEKLSKDLNIGRNVIFTGWVDYKYVPSYIAVSSVCLVPHPSGLADMGLPNKLFQYMAMKKPVVATDVKPIKRILEGAKSGIVFPSRDYRKMAEAIIKLHANEQYASELGINGRRAVETKYNWKIEAKKLLQVYDELEKRSHGRVEKSIDRINKWLEEKGRGVYDPYGM